MQQSDLLLISSSEESKSVSFRASSLNQFPGDLLSVIQDLAIIYPFKNIRICFHDSDASPLHQMLILERSGLYYPPHSHLARTELHYVYSGALIVCYLDQTGQYLSSIVNHKGSGQFTCIQPGVPHLTMPYSEFVIYPEIKDGPHTSFQQDCFSYKVPGVISDQDYMSYLFASELTHTQ